jgi:hypothetical protein
MKAPVLVFMLFFALIARSQADSLNIFDSITEIKPWTLRAMTGLTGTQTSFVNWAAGGRNNVTALAFFEGSAKYLKGRNKWDNDLKLALGGLLYMDSVGRKEGLQKTDDRIELSTSYGYEFEKKWFYTVLGSFKTQFLDGYDYPNDSVRISRFMAPAYVNVSLGIEYVPKPYVSFYLSPVAGKITIVNDEVLANEGAFGVDPAIRDTAGNILATGNRVRYEFGAYFRMKFEKTIAKNIDMKTKVELFSNYMENPQNIDVIAENMFVFKVNDWFSASLNWNLIYDDDINITDRNGDTGPRTQFKSVLGLGISYTVKNQ